MGDIIKRAQLKARVYHAAEWRQFCDDHGVHFLFAELPESLPSFVYHNVIVLRKGMSPEETRWWAWHEIGHWLAHVGNREVWRRMVCGDLILSKMERQASEFAQGFPEWDEGS